MPSFKVTKDSPLTAKDSFQRIHDWLQNDKDLRKLDPKYTVQIDAEKLAANAQGQHFKAQLKVESAGTGAQVEISVDLPFHLALMKGLLEKTLKKKLDEALA